MNSPPRPDTTAGEEQPELQRVAIGSSYSPEEGPLVHIFIGDMRADAPPTEARQIAGEIFRGAVMAEIHAGLCLPIGPGMVEAGEEVWDLILTALHNAAFFTMLDHRPQDAYNAIFNQEQRDG